MCRSRTAGQLTGPDERHLWGDQSAESAESAGAERDFGAEEQAVRVADEESASGRTSARQSSR
ncbi:hypothetical protein H0B56_06415 [Haloechinothrix sp. YIM 98757]|uniref:Uncharacterized protein n=1 Tax=Haloechinothrix aidingensis TaxID=2752311 RepID=A0A838A5W0_9PSEU|nr:hypothetical protein [Haloechinothrix aidingensis]MBA0125170.1 hypothetical protein [Haloechinothrix aidingensis]